MQATMRIIVNQKLISMLLNMLVAINEYPAEANQNQEERKQTTAFYLLHLLVQGVVEMI
jgi:hypothetical protein